MKKYNIIYADPPWYYSSGIRSSKQVDGKHQYYTPCTTVGAAYPTMQTKEIADLSVESIAAQDCVLFIWTTDSHLPDAMQVINAWGFTYRTLGFVWNKKETSGRQVCYYGHWTMKGTEICLLATRGKPHQFIKRHDIRQLVELARDTKRHSGKPPEVRDRIVQLMGDLPRIELFARRPEPALFGDTMAGWDVWGNEVESDIEL